MRNSLNIKNIQNIPKEVGLKENVIAPPGYVIVACDYSQEELITLAATLQHRYGKSRMADAINAGLDLHALFAAYRDGELKDVPLDMLTDPGVVATLKPLLKQYKEDKTLKPKRQLAKSYNKWAFV